MFFRDSLPAEIGSPLASCLLFFLVSQADNEGVVLLSYADIAKVFACSKARVQRLVQLLSAKHLVDTVLILWILGVQGLVATVHIDFAAVRLEICLKIVHITLIGRVNELLFGIVVGDIEN